MNAINLKQLEPIPVLVKWSIELLLDTYVFIWLDAKTDLAKINKVKTRFPTPFFPIRLVIVGIPVRVGQ